MLKSLLQFTCFPFFTIYRSTLFTHERAQNEDRILHVNIPFFNLILRIFRRQTTFCAGKKLIRNILSQTKTKKYIYIIISIKLSLVPFRYVLKIPLIAVAKFMHTVWHSSVFISFAALAGSSAGFFPDKTWSISPRYKKRLEFYLLTQSVNRDNERNYPL